MSIPFQKMIINMNGTSEVNLNYDTVNTCRSFETHEEKEQDAIVTYAWAYCKPPKSKYDSCIMHGFVDGTETVPLSVLLHTSKGWLAL
eukprot:scaffold8254_cov133-Chaetoceros_neogracile.AAC.6